MTPADPPHPLDDDGPLFHGAGVPLADWDMTRPLMWSSMSDDELMSAVGELLAAAPEEGTP